MKGSDNLDCRSSGDRTPRIRSWWQDASLKEQPWMTNEWCLSYTPINVTSIASKNIIIMIMIKWHRNSIISGLRTKRSSSSDNGKIATLISLISCLTENPIQVYFTPKTHKKKWIKKIIYNKKNCNKERFDIYIYIQTQVSEEIRGRGNFPAQNKSILA